MSRRTRLRRGDSGSGFDVALATDALQETRWGVAARDQWFESKIDDESSPTLEANVAAFG